MANIPADRHFQTLDAALVAADGQRVEQGLRGVFVRAVAGIDDGALHLLGQKFHGAGCMMAHDQNVGPHGVQRHRRVDQRLALLHRGGGDRHVHDIGAEPLAGQLEGGLGTGGGFEEQVDLGAAAQNRLLLLDLAGDVDGAFGQIQQRADIQGRQALDAEKVPMGEARQSVSRRERICGHQNRGYRAESNPPQQCYNDSHM